MSNKNSQNPSSLPQSFRDEDEALAVENAIRATINSDEQDLIMIGNKL